MTIKTVTYSQSKETMYGYGLKRWDKAGVEISMDENDNPENAFSMAKQLVDEQLSKIIHQEEEMKGTHVRDVVPDSNLSPTERMIKAIQACTELDGADGLLSFERLSNTNAEIKAVYDLQLLKLKKIASW